MGSMGKRSMIIGLEIHLQLNTKTKLFCSCPCRFQEIANTLICPVCLGLPGSLPVLNAIAVKKAVQIALALEYQVEYWSTFDRKHYMYPDLPKGYQITQHAFPLARNGMLGMDFEGKYRTIGLATIHLEEDAGKSIHDEDSIKVDFNRAGIPLVEIVTEPDLRSPQEAQRFLETLKTTMKYLQVSDCSMEEGSLRCDANISVPPGPRVELKNMNSFRAIGRALAYEGQRLEQRLDKGDDIPSETRGWDEKGQKTFPLRAKESEAEYRYFSEPDLPPLILSKTMLEGMEIPELPEARKERLKREYGLSSYQARIITDRAALADYFEAAAQKADPQEVCNWLIGEVLRILKEWKMEPEDISFPPAHLASLIHLVETGRINLGQARKIFPEVFHRGEDPAVLVERRGLMQVQDTGELERFVEDVLEENSGAAADYLGGKDKALAFLVGQVMKKSRGQAHPQKTEALLLKKIEEVWKEGNGDGKR